MWTAIAAIAGLATLVLTIWLKANDSRAKAKKENAKEASDAVSSSDNSRITSMFDKLRRK